MIHTTFNFDLGDLEIDLVRIEKAIGYKHGESDDIVSELITGVLSEARDICSIKAEYRIFNEIIFNETEKSVRVSGQEFIIGKIIYGQLKQSEGAALFLCTAGEEIGGRSSHYMKGGDLLKGYIYDIVGSEIAESAAEMMQNELEKELSLSGIGITNRFSPGYCGWDVADQHKLFYLMHDNFCGIRLTASALMDPVKSISGIIGTGNNVIRRPYLCNLCDIKDCIYRRTRESSEG